MFNLKEENVRKFYRYLGHSSDEWTELRAIAWPPSGSAAQVFINNEEDFVVFCKKWNNKRNVYAGVNPRKRKGGSAEDVSRVTIIPFDVDSPHPKGEPATDDELEEARKKAIELVSWICKKGFRPPMISMSGNGYHVLQRVNIEFEDLEDIKVKLESYFHEAPTKGMDSIFDPPRILKIPGTASVKGKTSEDRPHRQSYILTEGDAEPDSPLAEHIKTLEPHTETGKEEPEKPEAEKERVTTQKKIGRLKPCFRKFVKEGERLSEIRGEDHLLRLALVQDAHSKGFTRAEIISLFRNAPDFKEDLTTQQVNHELRTIMKKGPRPWRCIKIYKHHGCSLGEKCRNYRKNVEKYLTGEASTEEEKRSPEQFFAINEDGTIGAFIPKLLGDEVLKEHRFVATNERSELWVYEKEKGIWEPRGTELVQDLATEWLGKLFRVRHVNEVVKYIRYTNYTDHDIFGKNLNKIVLKNGVYDFTTGKLGAFDPELYEINQIPVDYDPDAECHKIMKYLNEVLHPEDFNKIIELMGYCLYKSYPIARTFVLTGSGRNGKSQLLIIIKNFLGSPNITSLTLQEISYDRFAKAQLYGKLANLAADIPAEPIKYTGTIKILTGGDGTSAQHKFLSRFEFVNYSKLVFSANEVPKTEDNTNAFFRRMIIVFFPNEFPADDPNTVKDLGNKISTPEELSGLFNLAVKGLERLLRNGAFTGEETIQERAEKWIKESNPAQYFVTKFIEMSPNTFDFITKDDMYQKYVQMCHAMGRIPLHSNTFSMEIKKFLPYIDEGMKNFEQPKEKGEKKAKKIKKRVWRGVLIKTNELKEFIDEAKKGALEKTPHGEKTRTKETPTPRESEGETKGKRVDTMETMETMSIPPPSYYPITSTTPINNTKLDSPTTGTGIKDRIHRIHRIQDQPQKQLSIIRELVSTIQAYGKVASEWPVMFLERFQIPSDKAAEIVEGLRLQGKIIQDEDDSSWGAPSK